jgi:hypothetical protein
LSTAVRQCDITRRSSLTNIIACKKRSQAADEEPSVGIRNLKIVV